eukprot:3027660-Alexandrium_andersonii.AAC.1
MAAHAAQAIPIPSPDVPRRTSGTTFRKRLASKRTSNTTSAEPAEESGTARETRPRLNPMK